MIDQTLSHFRITAKLGEGGMGEVYRAEDSKLGREVAIKVLPEVVAGDAERLARFQREAQVLASLNHPGIAGIHQVEEHGGVHFLVMELAEGEDLAQRVARKPLSVGEALIIAQQIAEALEAAHERGIVHRDLKPANVVLTDEGRVKVLDFGLARAFEEDKAGMDIAITQSPTLTAGVTQAGMILGTAAYMSPEQAVGKVVDKRTDIWAFGCVLFELVVGRQLFAGESVTETLSAVIRDEPDWTALPAGTPAQVRRLLQRCLIKDPWQRLRDIGDARIALAEAAEAPDSGPTPTASEAAGRTGPRWPLWVGTGLALIAAAAAGWWFAPSKRAATVSLAPEIVRVTSDSGFTADPALAPGGNLLAYSSDRGGNGDLDIWIQPLPSGPPVRVTQSDADDFAPHFSPDGSRIAYRSERDGGGIYVVPALGGTERLIAARGRQPRFSPDGRWIAYWTGGRGTVTEIYVVESGGGTPRRLVEHFAAASSPVWSPDSDFILFWGISSSTEESRVTDWWTIRPEEGSPVQTGVFEVLRGGGLRSHDVSAWVTGPERLLVTALAGHSQSVWELPFSESARRVAGPPQRLTAGTGLDGSPSLVVSEEGTQLFFSSTASIVNLWRLPVEADTARVVGAPQQLTDSVAIDTWPSVSADGQRIAYSSTRFGSRDIWMKDLTTGAETALTMMPGSERTPRISPDGSRVTFLGSEGQYVVTAEGGTPSLLTDETDWATDWPSAEMILVVQGRGISRFDNATQSLAPLIQEEDRSFYFGVASPDLRWFSFMEWLQADRTRLFIAPLGEGPIPESEWIAVTNGQHVDEENAWSPDGTLLYFMSERDGRRCLWAQRLDPATKQLQGDLLAVMHSHDMRHAMMPTKGGPQNIDVTPDAVYFSMQKLASNIWMATLER